MYIRRDKSNLHFGKQRRNGGGALILFLILVAAVVGIMWQYNSVETWVLASIQGEPTVTLDAITLARMGERAYLAGDMETSILYYGQAAAMLPTNIDILFEYGRVLIYRSYDGRNYSFLAEQALEVAQRAVEIDAENPRAQALLCFALVENDRAEEGISAGLRAVDIAPAYGDAYAYLSFAYYRSGRPNQAFEAGDQAVQLSPDSVDAHRALAQSLAYVGEFDAAVQQYERAIQIHPRLDALYFELALYYKAQDNYEAAIAAYDQVLMLEKDNVKAYTRKCETYYTMREDQLAQEACEQAIQLDPTYPEAHRQLGMVQYTRRNFEGAIESLETCANLQTAQGIPLEKQEIQCYYIRGLALALLADCDGAWPVLQEALQMNPAETIKGFINEGLMLCVNNEDEYNINDIPTAIPPTPVPPEPIGIF